LALSWSLPGVSTQRDDLLSAEEVDQCVHDNVLAVGAQLQVLLIVPKDRLASNIYSIVDWLHYPAKCIRPVLLHRVRVHRDQQRLIQRLGDAVTEMFQNTVSNYVITLPGALLLHLFQDVVLCVLVLHDKNHSVRDRHCDIALYCLCSLILLDSRRGSSNFKGCVQNFKILCKYCF